MRFETNTCDLHMVYSCCFWSNTNSLQNSVTEIVNSASLVLKYTWNQNKSMKRVCVCLSPHVSLETQTCPCEWNPEEKNDRILLFALHAQPIISNEALFTDFTDLLNVFMHVSSHLLGQLGFTCTNSHQTLICFYAINFIKQ